MTTIHAHGVEGIEVKRLDNERASLQFILSCEDGTEVIVEAGQWHEDAYNLHSILSDAAKDVQKNILDDWQDVPDYDEDGVVYENDYRDGGGYVVHLSGHLWDGELLLPHNQSRGNRNVRPWPTKEIAMYELARAMVVEGYFPNVWYVNERGTYDDIGEAVRAFHDEGGDGMKELEGVVLTSGLDVIVDDSNATIIKDYGTLGVVYRYDYSDNKGNEHTDDRSIFVPYNVCAHCGVLIQKNEQGTAWIDEHERGICPQREATGRYPEGKPHEPEKGDE